MNQGLGLTSIIALAKVSDNTWWWKHAFANVYLFTHASYHDLKYMQFRMFIYMIKFQFRIIKKAKYLNGCVYDPNMRISPFLRHYLHMYKIFYIVFLMKHFICLDINECEDSSTCQQNCTNSEGSFECSCSTGHVLENDRKSCTSNTTIVYVFWQCE